MLFHSRAIAVVKVTLQVNENSQFPGVRPQHNHRQKAYSKLADWIKCKDNKVKIFSLLVRDVCHVDGSDVAGLEALLLDDIDTTVLDILQPAAESVL